MKWLSTSILLFPLGINAFSVCGLVTQKALDEVVNKFEIYPKIFEDGALPDEMGVIGRIKNLAQFSKQTNVEVVEFLANKKGTTARLTELEDKLKIDPGLDHVRKIHTSFANEAIKADANDPDPIDGYRCFGNKNFKNNLAMLCQVNPFFASALTVSTDDQHLELIACNPEPKAATDSKCLTLMREMKKGLKDPSHRINVRFNLDMTMNQITKFDEAGKAEIVSEADWDYHASGVMCNVMCHVTSVHATIHVLHHLMTAAIISSTRHNPSLAAWTNPHDDNIAIKHLEVAALLFHSNLKSDKTQVVSGELGFGANRDFTPELRKVLCVWGRCKDKDDYMRTFLLKDLCDTAKNPEEVMKKAGILTEFTKHIDNVKPFGEDLAAAMKANDEKAFDTCQAKLEAFMSGTGAGVSSIDSIHLWVQLMCCTGITHGSTLSCSRMVAAPEAMRWRNVANPVWDHGDVHVISTGAGTIQGMTVDRHVFTGEIANGFKWKTDPLSKEAKTVLDKHDEMAETLKKEHTDVIIKRDNFRDHGWILTDHCKDGCDGKQEHTIATYI
jgi:hypothetical protein